MSTDEYNRKRDQADKSLEIERLRAEVERLNGCLRMSTERREHSNSERLRLIARIARLKAELAGWVKSAGEDGLKIVELEARIAELEGK